MAHSYDTGFTENRLRHLRAILPKLSPESSLYMEYQRQIEELEEDLARGTELNVDESA